MGARVLVVDDDDDIRQIVKISLELAGFVVAEASDGHEALQAASNFPPDAVVLDVMMPRMDGFSTVSAVRADSRLQHIPILMLTARAQSADAVEALRLGADDHIAKPFDPDELTARIDAMIRRAEQQRARNPLTGLPGNHAITRAVVDWLASERPCALAYADIDAFKPFNDHYGFLRGDQVLQATAQLMDEAAALANAAFVGHVGGDDFVIVCEPDDAHDVAAHACAQFDAMIVSHYDPDDRAAGGLRVQSRNSDDQFVGFITLSIGIATTTAPEQTSFDALVSAATEQKRRAKRASQHRSRWVVDGALAREPTGDESGA